MVEISWVSQFAMGSGSIIAVSVGFGSGVVKNVVWGWTLAAESSSPSPMLKEDLSIQRAKFMYLASVQQKFPWGITSRISSLSPTQNPFISVMSSLVVRWLKQMNL